MGGGCHGHDPPPPPGPPAVRERWRPPPHGARPCGGARVQTTLPCPPGESHGLQEGRRSRPSRGPFPGRLTFEGDRPDALLALDVPETHGLVVGAREQHAAVGRHGQAGHLVPAGGQGDPEPTAREQGPSRAHPSVHRPRPAPVPSEHLAAVPLRLEALLSLPRLWRPRGPVSHVGHVHPGAHGPPAAAATHPGAEVHLEDGAVAASTEEVVLGQVHGHGHDAHIKEHGQEQLA